MTDLMALNDYDFDTALGDSCFRQPLSEALAPFVAADVIARTGTRFPLLITRTMGVVQQAKDAGDNNARFNANRFLTRIQQGWAYTKPLLKEHNRQTSGVRPAGSTNWRKMALDAVAVVEAITDAEAISDDGLHDRAIDFLNDLDGDRYRYKSGVDSRPYRERRAASLAGMAENRS